MLVPVFQRRPSAAVRARFDQIEDGMTEQQVEGLLGGPRGVYDSTKSYSTITAVGTGSGRSHLSWWYFPDCAMEVGFDEDGRVSGKGIEALKYAIAEQVEGLREKERERDLQAAEPQTS